MNPNTVYLIVTASVVLGTVGGLLERFTKAGGNAYKIGVLLASLGTDLASLGKLFGGAAAATLLVLAFGLSNVAASCAQPAKGVANVTTSTVIPLTNAVCAVAPDSPVGQPFVDVICSIAQGTEQIVATIAQAIAAGGAETATTTAPVLSVRLRIPAESAPGFLAAHKAAR